MVSINSNYGAAFAANAAKQASSGLDSAMEKLSSGKRINYSKDDAAGQQIATRLTAEVQGLAAASRNASDAQGFLDTADGALGEVSSLLLRMREIAVQSQNDTNSTADRAALQAEVDALEAEITRIGANTSWAGTKILDGTTAEFTFQIGATGGTLTTVIADTDITALGFSAADVVETRTKAAAYLTQVDKAISTVGAERGKLGAVSNRLNSTVANLDQIAVNISASKGRIQDADFAAESGNLAKGQILQQAATAMLAQANASKQTVLALIR